LPGEAPAAGFVSGVRALGDDAFEVVFADGLENRIEWPFERSGKKDAGFRQNLGQRGAALGEWLALQVLPIQEPSLLASAERMPD